MRTALKIYLFALLCSLSSEIFAQGPRVEAMRAAFISKRIELSSGEAEKFWPVYNEYNDKIKALRKNLRQSYKKADENPSDNEAEELFQLDVKTKQAEADLHKQYGEKIKAIIGVKKLVKLHNAEEEWKREVIKSIKVRHG